MQQTNQDNLLEIKELNVSFFTPAGEVKAVRGLNYTLPKGKVLGIVGESGSGKSVSVNALMQLVRYPGRILSGEIFFDGQNVLKKSKRDMHALRGKEMSMIFQDPMTSLNPVFTIGNQLIETIKKHTSLRDAAARARAIEMLTLVGINNPERRMKQYPHEFSGGMRQRAMIAMALSCEPKLLIADEPTTALDVTIQAQIMELMKDLKEKIGTSIILITHDLGIISEICDEVIVIYAGRVVERGSIDDIFYRGHHPYTQGLLRCLPRVDSNGEEALVPIEGSPPDMLALPEGCAFAPRCEHCMKVCLHQMPPELPVADGHTSACWLRAVQMQQEEEGA